MQEITLQQLQPNYIKPNPKSAIYGQEITFKKGSNYHIAAPSGSGKTSLCNILYGINNDYQGSIFFDQTQSTTIDWQKIRREDIAVVFQDLRLIHEISALDNITLKNQLSNHFSHSDILAKASHLGIEHLLPNNCVQLSRGEQQRVAILRALCMPFKYIILDEVMSHLDHGNSKKAAQLIESEAIKNNATIINLNLQQDQLFNYHAYLNL